LTDDELKYTPPKSELLYVTGIQKLQDHHKLCTWTKAVITHDVEK